MPKENLDGNSIFTFLYWMDMMTIIRKNGLLFIFIIALSFKSHLISQNKIGLCLSGGGAKGLAHIGILKLIDSLGIKIDYITGTSMGGVIGALYACGYTGKQIDSLAKNLEWNSVLNQNVPLNEIYSDEKDEFGKYIGEIPIRNRKIFVTGIIEGQGLLNLFNRLTRHVNAISDFNKFQIPFKCMAVDIITAKQVVLDHGNLAIAMRATMSIPTVFKPVKLDNMLLIDGGLMNNFPVQELKNMGADIIIGSYTGGRLMNEKEMNTVNKLLIQTSSFYGIQESRDDMVACAIFNNLNDSILGYKAGDFEKSKKIIKAGENFAYEVLPKLIELANAQKNDHVFYKKEPLIQSNAKIKINSIYVDLASLSKRKRNNLRLETFIKDRISLSTKDSVKFQTIERSIKRLYGTRNFFKAYYTLTPLVDGSYDFTAKVEPDVKFRLKGALHFDTEIGTGAILNLTARNWLGKNSRLVGTLDLAQSPEYRIHYRKYFRHSNFSFNVNFLRTKVVQPMVFDSVGNAIRDYSILYRNFGIGLNCNFGIPSSLYIGIIGEINEYKSKYVNSDVSEIGLSNVNHLKNINGGLHIQYKYSTTNRVVFPKKGIDLFIENKVLISGIVLDYNRLKYDSLIKSNVITRNNLDSFAGFNDKLFFRLAGFIPFNKKISMFSTISSGLIFKNIFESEFSDTIKNIRGDGYFVGGAEQRARPNQVPLIGLKEGQLNSTDGFITLQLGVQFEVYPKLVISPMFNYCYAANSPKELFKNIPKIDLNNLSKMINETYWNTYTYGINIGYRSLFGPISVNVSKAAIYNKWQVYFTIGYKF